LIVVTGWLGLEAALAEIVPDASLPQASRVRTTRNRTVITAGTQRGGNLFHSFRRFSVASGHTASFQGVEGDITHLLVRVTGGSRSRINGVIEALQSDRQISNVNLFFINPDGIVFGDDASLRLGGSFVATTATSINFADGVQFSATDPQAAALLTVSVPVGLQFGDRPGEIVNQSRAVLRTAAGVPVLDQEGELIRGLSVPSSQTLALVGGSVTLDAGSRMRTNGGRVEIGSVAAAGEVTLTPISQGWDLRYDGIQTFGDINLFASSQVDTSGIAAGAIQLQGRRVAFREPYASLRADTLTQAGGNIEVTATDSINIMGILSGVTTLTEASGRAGDIRLFTQRLSVQEGGKIGSFTDSSGRAGDIQIRAAESITVAEISQDPPIIPGDQLSLLYTQTGGTGTAGNMRLETNRLQIRAGGQISANTFGSGAAGNITIRAADVELIGVALDPANQPLFFRNLPISGGLFVGTAPDSRGKGGALTIETQRLSVRDGAVLQATTFGQGNAGNVNLRASELIEVRGSSTPGSFPAQIVASSGGIPGLSTPASRQATGRGGNLNLTTPLLIVQEGGIVAVNSLNPNSAGAGTIQIGANQIFLTDRGQLNAQTESGDAARIQLSGVDLLVMRQNSNISTAAGLNSGGGSGGDIQIEAGFIVAAPAEDSNIAADAGEGDGGNIQITANGILGITERAQPTAQSDITASSESGVAGEIRINTPTLDPTQGLLELPTTIVDASQLIAQGCRAENRNIAATLGEFIITGRGGLPPNPNDLRSSDAVIADWATLDLPAGSGASEPLVTEIPESPQTIIEAQGWVRRPNGQVELVAQASEVTPTNSLTVACDSPPDS
jgi:filamentous hemagglutinin family protein